MDRRHPGVPKPKMAGAGRLGAEGEFPHQPLAGEPGGCSASRPVLTESEP
jgi:hypothetical protein